MSLRIVGKKKGMTQIFDEKGNVVVCTILQADPNIITQIKTKEKDGYNALQIGSIRKNKNISKPLKGHFEKNNVEPSYKLLESKTENLSDYKIGQVLTVSYFKEGELIDVCGVSKGKGFQGLMKKYGFAGMPASHGCSRSHRLGGSTGMRSTPGRCFKGGKRASRMGGVRTTTQKLKIIKIDEEKGIIAIKGSIPGSIDSIIYINKTKKQNLKAKK
ncbi:MAG: 50S ribosomal protein L3 [Candidatus Anoxychlamydiales bacterium]|nr:50S ribosomal protein L3 [Candidatus Anoxychlamydiales bacterium]